MRFSSKIYHYTLVPHTFTQRERERILATTTTFSIQTLLYIKLHLYLIIVIVMGGEGSIEMYSERVFGNIFAGGEVSDHRGPGEV